MDKLERNKKIKLLYCSSDNNASSGAFLAMIELCSNLKNNYNVDPLIIIPQKGDGIKLLEEKGLDYRIIRSEDWIVSNELNFSGYLRKLKKSLKNIIAVHKIIQIIKEDNIDIIHLNTIFTYVGALAGFLTRTPVIWHIREAIKYGINSKIIFENLGFNLINKSNSVIVISNTVKKAYPKLLPQKINVIYDGVDESKFYNPDKQIFNNENIQLICNGAVYKQKGQLDLIEASKILFDKGYKNWQLNFYGVGDLESLNNLIKKYDLESYIKVNGYTDKLSEKLEKTDIVVVPSYYEGFGRVTAEGMLSGCLVVGANIAGTTEIIDDRENGILFEVKNSLDLAEKIIWAIDNQEICKQIAQKGQQKVLDNFTSKNNSEKVYELLKKQ